MGREAQGQFAHFIEHQGAAIGLLEAALLHGRGPGEGALLVAEQFGFQQVLGDGGAVDGHEGAVPARAGAMDELGQQFLAGAALGLDEDGGAAVRGATGQGQGFNQHGILGEDHGGFGGFLGLEVSFGFQRLVQGCDEFLGTEGLGQEIEGAEAHGLAGGLQAAEGGDEQDGQAGIDRFQPGRELQPVHAGHAQIRDHGIIGAGPHHAQGLLAAPGLFGEEAGPFEAHGHAVPHPGIVVHHQHPKGSRHS
jgi:hypothetical protein